MDLIISFFNIIIEFINDLSAFFAQIWDFILTGLYDFFTEWFASFVIWSTVANIKFKILMLGFAWDVALDILTQLNISAVLSSAWSSINNDLLNALTFFNIPEAINIILSARLTKFVLSFIGL